MRKRGSNEHEVVALDADDGAVLVRALVVLEQAPGLLVAMLATARTHTDACDE